MRGFIVSLTTGIAVVGALIFIMLAFSFFSGGVQSSGLFGWGDIPLLSGIEGFITVIYNSMIVISSWMTIFVLLSVFLGVQGVFVYFYYRVAKMALHFREDVERIIDELLDV